MTFLFIIQCTDLGGMEQVTFRFSRYLQSLGHSVNWISLCPPGKICNLLDESSITYQSVGVEGSYSLASFAKLCRLIKLSKSDSTIVVGHSMFVIAALFYLKSSGLPSKLYQHIHFHSSGVKPRIFWIIYYVASRLLFRKCMFPSQFSLSDAYKHLPRLFSSQSVVIHNLFNISPGSLQRNCTPLPQSIETSGLSNDFQSVQAISLAKINHRKRYKLGCAGWLIPRKRFDLIFESLALLRRMDIEFDCSVAGGGPLLNELTRTVSRLDLSSYVSFEGWIDDMLPFYQSLDCFLFSSSADAVGMSPLEAFVAGTPSICCVSFSGLSEYIPSLYHDIVIGNSMDPSIYAMRIKSVLLDQPFAEKMTACVRNHLLALDHSARLSYAESLELCPLGSALQKT